MAQGQAITSTVTAAAKPCIIPKPGAKICHAKNVTIAIPRTVGTKIALMRSASRCYRRTRSLRFAQQPDDLCRVLSAPRVVA
jgi:hypothetical protein